MAKSSAESKTTKDHDVIKKWVEARGGRPTIVERTKSGDSAMLRIDFNEPDPGLEEVAWDEFFRIFDENGLSFLYQGETQGGEQSRFFKFVRE